MRSTTNTSFLDNGNSEDYAQGSESQLDTSTPFWKTYFPTYTLKTSGPIHIEERPKVAQCLLMGLQHVLTMFGSTVIGPLLMGISINTTLFFSGIGTLIFFITTGGRVPSYLGSSFGFIGVVTSSTGYTYSPTSGPNPHLDVALGGILICGLVLGVIGIIVIVAGHKWIEFFMPPVVTGTVVMTIGAHLSLSSFQAATQTSFDGWMAFTTIMIISLTSVYAPGILKHFPILIGMVVGYLIHFACSRTGIAPEIDYTGVYEAKWFAAPTFTRPTFQGQAISTIVPVCVVLLAENLGHIKAVGAMAEVSLDKYFGRAILGDAISTMISAAGGGPGTTTYAENIGVMAVTRVFSTIIFLIAALIAVLLGFIQKFGAAIHTIPSGVFGGLSIVLSGLITMSGARIWVEHQVDFKDTRNMLVAGIPIVIGVSMQTVLQWGNFQLDGIGLPTFSAVLLYQILYGKEMIKTLIYQKNMSH
ncbi:permease family-domain-containing protein [Spinellus fusiger]|nr:permease family-domain-containing protein [Spinellus fusiger]